MTEPLRLMVVTAHPDDESLGFGGAIARYAAEGVEVSLVVATRGQAGRFGDGSEPHPGPEKLGEIREAETHAAAKVLGIRHVRFLPYHDAQLDKADPVEASEAIAALMRELRPHVVLTFDPFGAYGHPDHVAVSQLATAATVRAASGDEPHRVQKLYYVAWSDRVWGVYERVFKVLRSTVDDVVRMALRWPEWSVTTTADAYEHSARVLEAVRCHRSQMAQYETLTSLSPEDHRAIWGPQEFYRVFSLVNGGRTRERDLFEGLR